MKNINKIRCLFLAILFFCQGNLYAHGLATPSASMGIRAQGINQSKFKSLEKLRKEQNCSALMTYAPPLNSDGHPFTGASQEKILKKKLKIRDLETSIGLYEKKRRIYQFGLPAAFIAGIQYVMDFRFLSMLAETEPFGWVTGALVMGLSVYWGYTARELYSENIDMALRKISKLKSEIEYLEKMYDQKTPNFFNIYTKSSTIYGGMDFQRLSNYYQRQEKMLLSGTYFSLRTDAKPNNFLGNDRAIGNYIAIKKYIGEYLVFQEDMFRTRPTLSYNKDIGTAIESQISLQGRNKVVGKVIDIEVMGSDKVKIYLEGLRGEKLYFLINNKLTNKFQGAVKWQGRDLLEDSITDFYHPLRFGQNFENDQSQFYRILKDLQIGPEKAGAIFDSDNSSLKSRNHRGDILMTITAKPIDKTTAQRMRKVLLNQDKKREQYLQSIGQSLDDLKLPADNYTVISKINAGSSEKYVFYEKVKLSELEFQMVDYLGAEFTFNNDLNKVVDINGTYVSKTRYESVNLTLTEIDNSLGEGFAKLTFTRLENPNEKVIITEEVFMRARDVNVLLPVSNYVDRTIRLVNEVRKDETLGKKTRKKLKKQRKELEQALEDGVEDYSHLLKEAQLLRQAVLLREAL